MIAKRPTLTYVATALLTVFCTAAVGSAEQSVILPGNVQMRVHLADELGNAVPGDRFLLGEAILVRAAFIDLAAAQAQADRDGAEHALLLAQQSGEPERVAAAESRLAEANARLGQARGTLLASPLKDRAKGLLLSARAGDAAKGAPEVQIAATPLDHPGSRLTEERTGGAMIEAWWSLDCRTAPPGRASLGLSMTPPGSGPRISSPSLDLSFEVVSPEAARPSDLCRATYVKAHVALEGRRNEDAVRFAQQAIQQPVEASDYNRMAAMHVLGDAHYALGNKQAALEAYRQLLEIARVWFPKSDLPAIIRPRVSELEAALSRP